MYKEIIKKIKVSLSKYDNKKVSLRQSIYISKRISFLLEAGVSLPNALELIADQLKKRGYLLRGIANSIARGQSITEVISQANIFGSSALPMIKIGEESGTLAESFSSLSEELEKRSLLKQKIIGAILYPACITAGMVVLIIVLMTTVFPKMLGVFDSLHVDLPISTKILIWISTAMSKFGILAGLVLAMSIACFIIYYNKTREFHLKIDKVILRIPLVSMLVRTYVLASVSNVIGLLLKNNSSLITSINVAGETCGNYAYKEILIYVGRQVSDGAALGKTLNEFPRFFSKEFADLISIGEQTGKLAETFSYAHTLYSRDLDMITKSLSSSIEPVLMIAIGLMIGVVAFSIVTPMYSITSHLHGT